METLRMTKKEADQLCVIQQVVERKITGRVAGQRLLLSQRQIKRKVKRVRREGSAGIIHKLRGRKSNNNLGEEIRRKIREFLMEEKHTDFSAPFAAEKLEEKEGLQVSVSTIWKIQLEAGVRQK